MLFFFLLDQNLAATKQYFEGTSQVKLLEGILSFNLCRLKAIHLIDTMISDRHHVAKSWSSHSRMSKRYQTNNLTNSLKERIK